MLLAGIYYYETKKVGRARHIKHIYKVKRYKHEGTVIFNGELTGKKTLEDAMLTNSWFLSIRNEGKPEVFLDKLRKKTTKL